MSQSLRIPAPPLSRFVELLWHCASSEAPRHAKERVMPQGSMSLIINLRDDVIHIYDREDPERCDRRRGSIVVGARAEFSVIDTADQAEIMGVQFKPGGAVPFLRPPAAEFEDQNVNLEDAWVRAAASALRERLLTAATPDAKFDVIEQTLLY